VEAEGCEALGRGVVGAGDCVGGEHMGRVGVWVAEEVGEGYGGERVVVIVGLVVDFDHFGGEVMRS